LGSSEEHNRRKISVLRFAQQGGRGRRSHSPGSAAAKKRDDYEGKRGGKRRSIPYVSIEGEERKTRFAETPVFRPKYGQRTRSKKKKEGKEERKQHTLSLPKEEKEEKH